jgi:hypothetical protein
MLEYEHEMQWRVSCHEILLKVRPGIETQKPMFTIGWSTARFHVMNLLMSQRSFDSDYFMSETVQPLVDQLFPHGRAPRTSRLVVQCNNCWVRFSKLRQAFFSENPLRPIRQPPYSPDLAPSNCWLFGHMKAALKGVSSKNQNSFLRESMTFERGATI